MFETHAHTHLFSPDAEQSLEELIAAARMAGFSGVVVTEHMDPDLGQEAMVFSLHDYFAAMRAARARMHDNFKLLYGIEAGFQPHLRAHFCQMVQSWPFDHVIGSVHALSGDDIYFVRDVFRMGREKSYAAYLDALIEMAASGRWFDVLGHYDYVTRFSGYEQPQLTYREQADRFDRLFQLIIANGQSLELNAGSIHAMEQLGAADPMPDPAIFRRYLELGGEFVTIGSDAHTTQDVGLYHQRMQDYLAALGFRHSYVFIDRKPHRINL